MIRIVLALIALVSTVNPNSWGQSDGFEVRFPLNLSVRLLSAEGMSGDIAFYEATFTNVSSSPVGTLESMSLGAGRLLRVRKVGGSYQELIGPLLDEEGPNLDMFPEPSHLSPGEKWSFIGSFALPVDESELKIVFDSESRRKNGTKPTHQLRIAGKCGESHALQRIYSRDLQLMTSFISVHLPSDEPVVREIQKYIRHLNRDSNLYQFLQFHVDTTPILDPGRSEENIRTEKQARDILERSIRQLRPGVRDYLHQMIPEIAHWIVIRQTSMVRDRILKLIPVQERN